VLSSDRHLAAYFEATLAPSIPGKKVANFIINNLLGTLNDQGIGIGDCPVTPEKLRSLLLLVEDGTLASNQANEVFAALYQSPTKDVAAIAADLGFKKADAGELEALVDQAIANNPSEVEAVKAGNEKLLNFLTGQVMKLASTKPNPKQVTELLRSKLL
jgi:aspartyl-tRNA(Asn)/glutamyl-tRNA(Gln) amidotransferase subunit B